MAMIRRGETVGVFQLGCPAQRAIQTRLGATGYEDLVASVGLIRPGPIKGNMVDPYAARCRGREPVSYLHLSLEPILKKTYGVVLFEEQAIEIAVAVSGFTPGEPSYSGAPSVRRRPSSVFSATWSRSRRGRQRSRRTRCSGSL